MRSGLALEMPNERNRVLVTGGCGFVGSALCRLLIRSGHDVVVLDNLSSGSVARLPPEARFIKGDICDSHSVARAVRGVSGVFHLAAIASVEQCNVNRAAASRTNLQGTVTILEETGDLPVVFTSSAAVYGDQAEIPVDEAMTPAPISSYAIDKLGSERHLQEAAELWGARCIAVRPFNIFGPGQSPDSPYSGVLTRFVEGARRKAALQVNGDGGQTRDFIHVDDVVRALMAAMRVAMAAEPGLFAAVNVCSGKAVSILDLARTVNSVMGSQTPIAFGPARMGDIRHSTGCPRRAEQLLGFRAGISVADGIAGMPGEPPAPAAQSRRASLQG
ncbi:NAD-dependent epimerase/dehydratase family protein [Tropicimonas sp.]|uniref:NAD-dependent epimerase/dehydratase family protein n=1 Tax=Tropicimonas sp. TaxID=2067044 RepID=UPI003A8C7320